MTTATELLARRCNHQTQALNDQEIIACLQAVPEWQLENQHISRAFEFKNYYRTMAFVNAIAYLFHAEDHHADLLVTYKRCTVTFHTHSAGGLSDNDFICAAKVDAIYQQSTEPA